MLRASPSKLNELSHSPQGEIDRGRPKAAKWSPMTRLNTTQEAGSSSWRLAAGGATTHHRPLKRGYPENSG